MVDHTDNDGKAETPKTVRRTALTRLPDDAERYICRFDPTARRELRRLIRQSVRFLDLAKVFPGAAYLIAARCRPRDQRTLAQDQIIEGAALRTVAKTLDIPLWLRRLPPEAFSTPDLKLPSGEAFTRRIAARLPGHACDTAFWLQTLSFANEACSEDFALWLAEQQIYDMRGEPSKLFAIFSAYAWHSTQAAGSPAHDLIVVPWRPEIAFDTALCAAKSWLNRLRLVIQLGSGVISDPWLDQGASGHFDFVALTDQHEILEEAQAMQNCADQYADRLARDKCRLFSIRRGHHRIATLEIGPHPREAGVLAITQLKARHNMPASIEVWQAAHAWLASQTGLKRLQSVVGPERPFNNRLWNEMFEPYREATGGAPWITRKTDQAAFLHMDASLADLAKRGGVTSWLFT
ncbi:MAG: hypothetical protein AAFV45_13725 [Pseudomonadota bacterium]